MDYIYSKIDNNLIDVNKIDKIDKIETLIIETVICAEKDQPLVNLSVGDYYLKVTFVNSEENFYYYLSDINDEINRLKDQINKLQG